MDFKQLLEAIPEVKKEDILSNIYLLEDIEKIHPTLTLENPLTYIVYMTYNKSLLSIEERNDIYRIIDRLKKNHKNAFEASIEKQGMRDYVPENDNTESSQFQLDDCEDEVPQKIKKVVTR